MEATGFESRQETETSTSANPDRGGDVALFTPRAFDADELKWRGAHYLSVIAQPKPGVTVKQAQRYEC